MSSFFRAAKYSDRPQFQKCFTPLPKDVELESKDTMKRNHNILGVESSEIKSDFDPLLPLQECLERDPSSSTASALAPLCISLGVPNGYINARALIERIKRAKRLGHKLPCYENEVLPAVKRLNTPKDGADLAEWCAMQYKCDSVNRLNCLELALNLAVRVSTEAELNGAKRAWPKKETLYIMKLKHWKE